MKFSAATFTVLFVFAFKSFALTGIDNIHDPSSIIKDGDKYYLFSTGGNITMHVSSDLVKWAKSEIIFPDNAFPAWIKKSVPAWNTERKLTVTAGYHDFWAPECVYMNGKYYLYYAVSDTYLTAAIGLATNETLDPNNPKYQWKDEGMVISSSAPSNRSSASSVFNANDPAIFKDGKDAYLVYGSFYNGIGMAPIDTVTGKPKGKTIKIAGGTEQDYEAAYIFKKDNYYYLVTNRGYCCRGANSSYFMTIGRSSNPTGPYLDNNSVDMAAGGGKYLLSSSGRYIGPGHFGLYQENGVDWVSMHYYDAEDKGNFKLDIAQLVFQNGWPVIKRDWILPGRYKITNKETRMVWDSYGCKGENLEPLTQMPWNHLLCQQWDLALDRDGIYTIVSAFNYHAVDVPDCNAFKGAHLQMWDRLNNNCQKFKIDRTTDGSFVFTSVSGPYVLEAPATSVASTKIRLGEYDGSLRQKWLVTYAYP